ncbi:MAG: glutamate racemase [Muribaculaceae bacterium]|nr:glutamate racemase [Muribaculaceae bacterium]
MISTASAPIGIFDSGYGGLTILKEIRKALPQYDYIYLGDNARAPYGTRSFDIVYRFTLESVKYLFSRGCRLVILACNTASAKALRTIQQHDLPGIDPSRRVLGVIRPTVERLGEYTQTGHIGIFGTPGTIQSESYNMEISKLHPAYHTVGHACPMWVPLIENGESGSDGADYFVRQEIYRLLDKDPAIDTIILACTHYPILYDKIRRYVPEHIRLLTQGEIVASSLAEYLKRHPEMERSLHKSENSTGECSFLTSENSMKFSTMASLFLGTPVMATTIEI